MKSREDWEREHQEAEAMYEIRYQAYQTASGEGERRWTR